MKWRDPTESIRMWLETKQQLGIILKLKAVEEHKIIEQNIISTKF